MKKSEKFYTTGEIDSSSHVAINAVKKRINAGNLIAFKTPGGRYRARNDEFRAFLSNHRLHLAEDIFLQKHKTLEYRLFQKEGGNASQHNEGTKPGVARGV